MAIRISSLAPTPYDTPQDTARKTLALAYNTRAQTAAAANLHAPSAATAAVVTKTAVAGVRHSIKGIAYSYSATPTGGNIKVEDVSGTTVFSLDIASAEARVINFPVPLRSAAVNTAMIVTLASGAGSVVGKVNILGYNAES